MRQVSTNFRDIVWLILLLSLILPCWAYAQCKVKDPVSGEFTTTPVAYIRCQQGASFQVELTFQSAPNNTTIDWGDGTTGTVNGTTATHTYTTPGKYTYTITGCGGTTKGLVVYGPTPQQTEPDFAASATGRENLRCLPNNLFVRINRMGDFDFYRIDWGDGTDTLVDASSVGKDLIHPYSLDLEECEVNIQLSLVSGCGNGESVSSTFGTYYFLKPDEAQVAESPILLCEPAEVTITDASQLRCFDDLPRQIKWYPVSSNLSPQGMMDNTFRDYNEANKKLVLPASAFPVGTAGTRYEVGMVIQNQCGADTVIVPIAIVEPVVPRLNQVNGLLCPQTAHIFRHSTPQPAGFEGKQMYEWNWGDGTPIEKDSGQFFTKTHTFAVGGEYTVTLTSVIYGHGGQTCRKESSIRVRVANTVSPIFEATPSESCDSITFKLANKSVNTQNAVWNFWTINQNFAYNGGPQNNPGQKDYLPTPGVYRHNTDAGRTITVFNRNEADSTTFVSINSWGLYRFIGSAQTQGGSGGDCRASADTVFVRIFPSPVTRWRLSGNDICLGQPITVRDSSAVLEGRIGGHREVTAGVNRDAYHFMHIAWELDFGDGQPGSVIRAEDTLRGNHQSNLFFDNPEVTDRINSYTYAEPGEYWVKLRVSSAYCSTVDSMKVTVRRAPEPALSLRKDNCNQALVTFVNETQHIPGTRYEWVIRRGGIPVDTIFATTTDPLEVPMQYSNDPNGTNYTVVLVARAGNAGAGGCQNTSAPVSIFVPYVPNARFEFTTAAEGCSPLRQVGFRDLSTNVTPGSRYVWDFGNGETFEGTADQLPEPRDFVSEADTIVRYSVKLSIIKDGDDCEYSFTQDLVLFPSASLVITGPDTVCPGQPAEFRATGNSLTISTLVWTFEDGSEERSRQTVSRIFDVQNGQTTTYTMQLRGRNAFGCMDTLTRQIVVVPTPEPSFEVSETEGCSPHTVTFVNTTEAPDGESGLYYVWNWGDGSRPDTLQTKDNVSHTFVHTGANARNYPVSLSVVSGGCRVSTQQTILVWPELQANIELANPADSAGCSTHQVRINNYSTRQPGFRYRWEVSGPENFSIDDVFQPQGGFFLNNEGTDPAVYQVVFSVSNDNCVKSDTVLITVYPQPKPTFVIASANPMQLPDNTVRLRNTTPNAEAYTFTWDFGNGVTQQRNDAEFDYAYPNLDREIEAEYYVITLTAVSNNTLGCSNNFSDTLYIRPPKPVANFEASATEGCPALTVKFNNSSRYASPQGYFWDFGDGNTSTQRDPEHTYQVEGQYTVTLTVTGPGGRDAITKERLVNVYAIPLISFTTVPSAPRRLRIPRETLKTFVKIEYEDPAEQYTFHWDFGDGKTSAERDAEHAYEEPGIYNIVLTVTNRNGCSASYQSQIEVIFIEDGTLMVPTAFSPSLDGPTNSRLDPTQPSPGNDIFYPIVYGASEIRLQIFSRWGELLFSSTEMGHGWDGYYNGRLCQQDVYVYKLDVRFANGTRQQKMGDITLIR